MSDHFSASVHRGTRSYNSLTGLIVIAVFALAFLLGQRASMFWLGLLLAGMVGLVLLRQPVLGLFLIIEAALFIPIEFGTGTEVKLNLVTLLIPAMTVLWMVDMLRRGRIRFAASVANLPLLFFILSNFLSLWIGRVTWDPFVPVGQAFILVQLAQWGMLAFSALAFWLSGNLVSSVHWLRRLVWAFLLSAGSVAILQMIPGTNSILHKITTIAFIRAPLWALLAGMAGGQLLFNRSLNTLARAFLILALTGTIYYCFFLEQDGISNWIGVSVAFSVLGWLRFPRLRWLASLVVVALIIRGILLPSVYQFAGGDTEWTVSGLSRLALTRRVLEVTMHNPITGLGPAAYRVYAAMQPLQISESRAWVGAVVSSHNNYVDLLAHGGLVALAFFVWFIITWARLGTRLRNDYLQGFEAGYVNGVLAVGAASLVLMLFADWILPFVYNIGFSGFQASILIWLFLGGLVALENMPQTRVDK